MDKDLRGMLITVVVFFILLICVGVLGSIDFNKQDVIYYDYCDCVNTDWRPSSGNWVEGNGNRCKEVFYAEVNTTSKPD